MIQRIQSVWLLLASIAIFLTIKLPIYSGTNAKNVASYELTAKENFLLLTLTILTGLLALLTLFLFKKRKLQKRLALLIILLDFILLFLYYQQIQHFTQGTYALFAVLHSFVIGFSALAFRSINKDEKLIKSTDRLR